MQFHPEKSWSHQDLIVKEIQQTWTKKWTVCRRSPLCKLPWNAKGAKSGTGHVSQIVSRVSLFETAKTFMTLVFFSEWVRVHFVLSSRIVSHATLDPRVDAFQLFKDILQRGCCRSQHQLVLTDTSSGHPRARQHRSELDHKLGEVDCSGMVFLYQRCQHGKYHGTTGL